MERFDVADTGTNMGAPVSLLHGKGDTDSGVTRRDFSCRFADKNTGETNLRPNPRLDIKPCRGKYEPVKILRKISNGGRRDGTMPSNGTPDAAAHSEIVEPHGIPRKTYAAAVLEGGKPLVRNGSVDQRTVLRSGVQQNCNLVGKAYEDVPPKPISPIHVYRHRGTGHGGARKVCSATKASPTDVMGYNFTSGCRDKENSRIGFRVTFGKARGDHSSSRGGGKRQSKFGGGPASCKTSERNQRRESSTYIKNNL